MKNKTWQERLRDEFAINFKDCPDELLFLEHFIADELDFQRKGIVEMIEGMIKTGDTNTKLSPEQKLLRAVFGKKQPMSGEEKVIYNQALSDLLKAIKT